MEKVKYISEDGGIQYDITKTYISLWIATYGGSPGGYQSFLISRFGIYDN